MNISRAQCRFSFVLSLLMIFMNAGQSMAADIFVCLQPGGGQHFTNAPDSASCVPFRQKKSVAVTSIGRWTSGSQKTKWGAYHNTTAYDSHIERYGTHYNIDPNLIKAVIHTESDFNRYAVSRRGAQGLMQLMPETARELSVSDPFDPKENIKGGTRYLRCLLDMFGNDLTLALAAYNAGPTTVKKAQKIPPIPETILYVKRVLAYYEGYGQNPLAQNFEPSMIRVRGLVTVQ